MQTTYWMCNKTLLDSALPIIQEHLEELWNSCEKPRALYARGSSILPTELLIYTPWDIDFVLFVSVNEELATRTATEIMSKIRKSAPSLPPPDIKILSDNFYLPESLSALLLVSADGKLILGDDCRLSKAIFPEYHNIIFQHALKVSEARLTSFKECTNHVEQQKRAPHLIKSVLRLGGLLKLHEGYFTRQPSECATLITKVNPSMYGTIEMLLGSLQSPVDPKFLSEACHNIIGFINRNVSGDPYRN